MVAVHMITALAQKETAKQTILKQLREAGATSAPMPGSVELDGEEAEAALAELIAAGTVHEARPGLYFVDEAAKKAVESRQRLYRPAGDPHHPQHHRLGGGAGDHGRLTPPDFFAASSSKRAAACVYRSVRQKGRGTWKPILLVLSLSAW